MRHGREVDDVISGFSRFARFGTARVDQGSAAIVLQRKRTTTGRGAHSGFGPREGRRGQTAKHVPAFIINPRRRSAAVRDPVNHDVRQQFIPGKDFLEVSIMIGPPVPFLDDPGGKTDR
jgi:hypothetical protein